VFLSTLVFSYQVSKYNVIREQHERN
jgi:hypothetical protein